jgi:hypothetical protein
MPALRADIIIMGGPDHTLKLKSGNSAVRAPYFYAHPLLQIRPTGDVVHGLIETHSWLSTNVARSKSKLLSFSAAGIGRNVPNSVRIGGANDALTADG